MKKIVINVLLLSLAGVVGYLLYKSIERPIHFKNEWANREQVVRERLKEIAELQKMYKSLRNSYASNFDTLALAFMQDTFVLEKVFGDEGNENAKVERRTRLVPAKDSLMAFLKKNGREPSSLESYFADLRKIPFSQGKEFDMKADSAQADAADGKSVFLPTFEVKTMYANYMPEFDSSYMVYQPTYDPSSIRKIGDLAKPSTNGNW